MLKQETQKMRRKENQEKKYDSMQINGVTRERHDIEHSNIFMTIKISIILRYNTRQVNKKRIETIFLLI